MLQEIQTSFYDCSLRRIVEYLRDQAEISKLKEQVSKERRELSELSPELLRDIGVTEADAREESNRAYDDVPKRRLLDAVIRR